MTKKARLKYLKARYTKSELIAILYAYDQYIIGFDEKDYAMGRTPVCVSEFVDNDYRELIDWEGLVEQVKKL